MKLIDLYGKVPDSVFWETCRTKLHGTMVTYEDKWWQCSISEEFHLEDGHVRNGKGNNWITLRAGKLKRELNDLTGINTEPTWPKAGMYFIDNKTYYVIYNKGHIYKAGLSPNQTLITHRGRRVNPDQLISILTTISNGDSYPSVAQCTKFLLTTPNTMIPLSRNIGVSTHPYINGPVLTYGETCVGTIDSNHVVHLSPPHHNLGEYLDHIGVSYQNAN